MRIAIVSVEFYLRVVFDVLCFFWASIDV